MKKYKHFGKDVILLYLENDFLNYLRQEAIDYRKLPIILGYPFVPRDYVVAYTSIEGTENYALVSHECEGERVLIIVLKSACRHTFVPKN